MMFNAKANLKTLALGAALAAGSAGVAAAAPAVVTNDLNLRAGPGTGYGIVAVLPEGATVNAFGCSGNWCRVNYGGYSGFASAGYLDVAGGAYGAYAAAPPPPPPVYVAPGPYVGFGFGWHRWHRHHHWHHHH